MRSLKSIAVVLSLVGGMAMSAAATAAAPAGPAPIAVHNYSCTFAQNVGGYADGLWPMGPPDNNISSALFRCPNAVSTSGELGPKSFAFTADVRLRGVQAYSFVRHAFLQRNGRVTDVGAIIDAVHNSSAMDVASDGQVVGYMDVGGGMPHGYLYSPATGTVVDLTSEASGPSGGAHLVGLAINDGGFVAMATWTGNPYTGWTSDLWMRDGSGNYTHVDGLQTFTDGPQMQLGSMNNAGEIVGSRQGLPWYWDSGLVSGVASNAPLALGGDSRGGAGGINFDGVIVGSIFGPSAPHAVQWADAAGSPATLSEGYSEARAINDAGTAAGWVQNTASGFVPRATTWTDGTASILRPRAGDSFSVATSIDYNGRVGGASLKGSNANAITSLVPVTWG